jgi:hypothetical protein
VVPDYCAMTEKSRKAKVTEENRGEAAALKKLYDGEPHNGRPSGLTQAAFGVQYDIGSQAVVWQYLNGTIPLNLRVATGFARGLKCRIADFSPRLAKEASALTSGQVGQVGDEKILSFLDLNRTEAQLVALFRDLDEDRRADLLQHINKLHNEAHPHPSPANPFATAKKKRREPAKADR